MRTSPIFFGLCILILLISPASAYYAKNTSPVFYQSAALAPGDTVVLQTPQQICAMWGMGVWGGYGNHYYWWYSDYRYPYEYGQGYSSELDLGSTNQITLNATPRNWTEQNPQGMYYNQTGEAALCSSGFKQHGRIWNYNVTHDVVEVTTPIFVTFHGYVNDAETELPISGAVVNITQNSIISNTTTIADGNYTATGFYNGAALTFNITAAGYSQYYAGLTPLATRTINLNFTLNSTSPSVVGLGIGGVARDGLFDGSTITMGYGRPLSGVSVFLLNTTNGESYTKTTNMAGWYLCDEGSSCFLTTKRPYDIWGEKLRYDNSPNYTAVAA